MNSCPNENLPEYKILEAYLGKKGVYALFMANNEQLPTLEAARKIVQLDQNKQEEKAIEEIRLLSKEGLSKKLDAFFNVIKTDWMRLGYSKYSEIRKIFDNPQIGNEFKSLYERLRDVAGRDVETQFEQKVRGFALSLQQLNNIINKIQDTIKAKDYSQLPEKEALQELSKYLTFLNEWKYTLEDFAKDFKDSPEVLKMIYQIQGSIDTTKQIINESREFSLIDEIVNALQPTFLEQKTQYEKDLARIEPKKAEAEKRGDTEQAAKYQKRIDEITEAYNKIKVDRTAIIEYLTGKRGDTNVASALFEAEINSPDPITAVVKLKLTNVLENVASKVAKTEFIFQNKIKPLLDKLGADRFNIFDFNKQFVTITKHISKNGSEYSKLEFMDKFSGDWEFELESLLNAIDKARAEDNKEEYDKARIKLAKFNKDYMHQEYKDIVYDRYELWNETLEDVIERRKAEAAKKGEVYQLTEFEKTADPSLKIGEIVYLKRKEVLDNLSAITKKLKENSSQGFDMTEEEQIEYKEELNKLKRLSSLYDANGDIKQGEDLEVALLSQEYNKRTANIYEWKERTGAFERARERFKQNTIANLNEKGLDEKSPEFEEAMDKWDKANSRRVIKPEFYEERQKILNLLKALSSKVKDKIDQSKVKDFEEGWTFIFDQLKGYRNQDGQPMGSEISEGKTAKIKSVQEQLEFLKSQMEGLSGLTSEESDELSRLNALSYAGVKLTQEQKDTKKSLENKRNTLGLSKGKQIGKEYIRGEIDDFYDVVDELKKLQSKIPTDDYVDTLNQVAAPLGKVYDKETSVELLSDQELNELLQDPNFKAWFEKNHIKVKRYNEEKKKKEDVWERLYIWNQIVPNDPKYYKTTTLADGTVLQGLPDFQYYYRDVKDAYKTEEIVGTTVDNRGNFLPKSYDKNGKLEAKTDKFINKEFYQLKKDAESGNETAKAKYDYLQALKEQTLKFQEDTPSYADRLYLEVPRDPKTLSERVRSGEYKGIMNSFVEKLMFWDDASKDREETNRQRIDKKIVKADLFGNEITAIPVKFTGALTPDTVSLNLASSIYKYGLSLESKKALAEEQPFIEALEDMLEAHGKYSLSKVKLAYTKMQNTVSKFLGRPPMEITEEAVKEIGTYQRLENVRNLQEQYLQGIYKKGMLPWMERGLVTDLIDSYIFNPILRIAGFGVMSLDVAGAVTNQLAGNIYLIFDSISDRSFSIKDYLNGVAYFHSKLLPSFIEDIDQPLGKKSLQSQLFDIYNPENKLETEIGSKYDTNFWLNVGDKVKDFFLNPRIYGEIQIAATVQYAMLNNVRVQIDGKEDTLMNAYEKDADGFIKLKDNVTIKKEGVYVPFTDADQKSIRRKISQALRETQGNYAKQDKTLMERSSLGGILMFMRRYFVPLLTDAWQVRRFNIAGGSREGYNLTALRVMQLTLQGIKDKTNYWEILSPEDKRATRKAMAFWSSTIVFFAIVSLLDPDDEKRKYKKTKNWDWARLNLLLQALRVKSEVEQFTPVGGANEMIKVIKNPLMVGNKLSQMNSFFILLAKEVTKDPKGRYSKGYKKMMDDIYGTDSKFLINFYKIFGYRGGGLESFIPGSEKSKETTAYRLKQTVEAQERQ